MARAVALSGRRTASSGWRSQRQSPRFHCVPNLGIGTSGRVGALLSLLLEPLRKGNLGGRLHFWEAPFKESAKSMGCVGKRRASAPLALVGHVGATNKVARSTCTCAQRCSRGMGHVNGTPSTLLPEVDDSDNSVEAADQALTVFLGISFMAMVCVILSYTVVASTLREFDDWSRRKTLAELELAEVTEFPRLETGCELEDEERQPQPLLPEG